MKIVPISTPYFFENEVTQVKEILCDYLFHLRKPNATVEELILFLSEFSSEERRKIIIHSHYHLVDKMKLKGGHFKTLSELEKYTHFCHKSISCHTTEEIEALPKYVTYAFLSPVFDSISKENYPSKFDLSILQQFFLSKLNPVPVMALGGINEENAEKAFRIGFDGVATLGYLWKEVNQATSLNKLKCLSSIIHGIKFQRKEVLK